MAKKKLYVVTMYKFANRERHSYVHGVFTKKAKAINEAENERMDRGGNKYYQEILEFDENTPYRPDPENIKIIVGLDD